MKTCPKCGSSDCVRAGFRKNKSGLVQKYRCRVCNHYFVDREGFNNCRTRRDIIVCALNLRANGVSLGKVQQHLREHYNYRCQRSTIMRWEKKFGAIINRYTAGFKLDHVQHLHVDEVFLRKKGQRKDEFLFYWDAIDYCTKFLVADHMSLVRDDEECTVFLNNCKLRMKGPPDEIHTDNSYDYPPAIKKTFGRKHVKHVHFPAWKRKFKNNPIERFHNTLRENYKVMRRFNGLYSGYDYLILFRNYYNFIRPHTALGGKTPAQAAGFGTYDWYKLIKELLGAGYIAC